MKPTAIKVIVNGEVRQLTGRPVAPELLTQLGINQKLVAVAINGTVIRRSELSRTLLSEGDEVEIVRAVGGG